MTTTKAQRCVSCGAVDSITPTTPSRTITYRSVSVTIPPLNLPECGSCHDMQLDDAQSDLYSAAIDAAYVAAIAEAAAEERS
jgi:S-ribosylhomocysteine lyase LuxS involved in autoinducer biosynthesis